MRIGNKCCEFKKFLKFSERYVISFLRLDRIRNTFTAWIEEKVFNADHSNPQYFCPNLFQLFYSRIHIYKKKSCEKILPFYTYPTTDSNATPFCIEFSKRHPIRDIRSPFPFETDDRSSSRKEKKETPLLFPGINFRITGGQRSVPSFKYNFPDYFSGLDVGRSRNNVAVIDRETCTR